jgi:hypothetical protein
MHNHHESYTETLRTRIARVLAHKSIGLLPTESSLPEPKLVLPSESEASVTCYYLLAKEPDPPRIIAVKYVADPGPCKNMATARDASPAPTPALLPIGNGSADDRVFVYDDGKWISKVLIRLKLIPDREALPPPDEILSGRAGLSRVYKFRLRSGNGNSQPQTYLVKFVTVQVLEAKNTWSYGVTQG